MTPGVRLLRDFTLELRNESGQISARQYMERAFDCRRGTSSRIQEYNRVRSSFKQLFTDRDCCTLGWFCKRRNYKHACY